MWRGRTTVKVNVLLFATLKEKAGANRIQLEMDGNSATVNDVRAALAQRFPAMAENVQVALAALNEEYAFASDPVQDGDELAFFPPVSGGSETELPTHCRLADQPIDHDALIQSITTPGTGAVVVFSGMVRGQTRQADNAAMLETQHLEYEAYESMAVAKMKQVAAEIRQQWPLVQGVAIVQRVGRLEVGQNTILIACSAGHRNDGCFEAAKYGIDRLKEIVPVWKKEVRPDGSSWVEGGYIPTAADQFGE
jgi:molybdopterin converting factor subunit 1